MVLPTARAISLAASLSLAFLTACSDSPSPSSGGGGGATATTCATQGDCENGFTCDTVKKVCVSNMGGTTLDAKGGGDAGITDGGGTTTGDTGAETAILDTTVTADTGAETAILDTTVTADTAVGPSKDSSCKPCTDRKSVV